MYGLGRFEIFKKKLRFRESGLEAHLRALRPKNMKSSFPRVFTPAYVQPVRHCSDPAEAFPCGGHQNKPYRNKREGSAAGGGGLRGFLLPAKLPQSQTCTCQKSLDTSNIWPHSHLFISLCITAQKQPVYGVYSEGTVHGEEPGVVLAKRLVHAGVKPAPEIRLHFHF